MLTASERDNGELIGTDLACCRGERLVFARLDCRVPVGGALVLTGHNGSGKSSLLRLLATLLRPEMGALSWRGRPVAQDVSTYRAALHYVGHLDATKPTLTPRETLRFWSALRGNTRPAIDAALATFGLEAIAEWPCGWLSAGQRHRLALARLVASPAPVWLLDEPSSALDSDGEARLVAAIAEHRAAGGCVVLATHQAIAVPNAATLILDDYAITPGDALAMLD